MITFNISNAKTDPLSVLKELGLQTLVTTPIDFELKSVKGDYKRLSDYKGKWIWINFWATWCGPCQYEMPTLESIHQELEGDQFVVLGISIDRGGPQAVKRFLDNKGITFTNLLDSNGEVSSKYKANAVPSIYVISPDWKLVGIYRGAKNWEGLDTISKLKELMAFKKVSKEAEKLVGDAKGESQQLLKDLAPPKLTLKLDNTGYLAKTHKFKVYLSWKGPAYQYAINVPKVTLPTDVELGNITSSSDSSEMQALLKYEYPLTFKKSGDYVIGPVELSYKSRAGGQELFSRAPAINISIRQSFLAKWWWIFLIIVLLISLVALILIKKKTSHRKSLDKDNLNQEDMMLQRFETIKKYKLEKSKKDYSIGLLELYNDYLNIDEEDQESEINKVSNLIEAIRYAGKELTDYELIHFEKQINRKNNMSLEE